MKKLINAIESKSILIVIVYFTTMFMPWREVDKGTSVFTILPMWWEYGNPVKNYLSISMHIIISMITGLILYIIIRTIRNKLGNDE